MRCPQSKITRAILHPEEQMREQAPHYFSDAQTHGKGSSTSKGADIMKRSAIIACLILAANNIQASGSEVASDDMTAEIKTLQKERVETLKSLVELYVQFYQGGKIDITPVIGAQTELVTAQLESTENPDERIALLTERLNAVTSFLKLAEQRWMAGMSSQADVYRAKSLLLDTKIKLLREQGARKARPK